MNIKIDSIIRSARKTLSIEVSPGRVVVRAPRGLPREDIREFVEAKAAWINEKRQQLALKTAALPVKGFTEGEEFLYLGQSHPLRIVPGGPQPLRFEGNTFLLSRPWLGRAREVFTAWYKEQALQIITERTARLAPLLGVEYKRLKISGARTRWGSCSNRGNLNFSWRVVMAPLPVIDYLAAHELAHLLEMNHSPRFWQKVSAVCPDYKSHLKWLREQGHLLAL